MNARLQQFHSVFLPFAIGLAAGWGAQAQVVSVTLKLETNRLAVGESAILQVHAQIVPDKRASTDRIFSWYVDLLNTNSGVAQAQYDTLQKPAADKDPLLSSNGTTDGPNRRGIYDTFLNLAGAGRDAPVELFSVPVRAVTVGATTFSLQAGSTVPSLANDFIVAPASGGEPLVGGIYTGATATLEVIAGGAAPSLAISASPLADGRTKVLLSYPVIGGSNYFVEFKNSLASGTSWQTLPGGPHNAGTLTETNSLRQRFYRLRVGP